MTSDAFDSVIERLRAIPVRAAPREPAQWRAELDAQGSAMLPPEDVTFEPVSADGVPAEWVVPEKIDERILMYLHGGGYVCGSLDSHRTLAANLARASECRVLNVAYRLAPEHPCPAAIEDATTAFRWLLSQGYTAEDIAMAGDSAGGGLTIATMVALRDAENPLPSRAVLICPWTDLSLSGDSIKTQADTELIARAADLQKMAEWYAQTDPANPQASPLFADLKDLPPVLVHVGTGDILVDDGRRMVARLLDAGVDAELDEWQDMIHVWHAMAPILPEGMEAIARIGAYLRA